MHRRLLLPAIAASIVGSTASVPPAVAQAPQADPEGWIQFLQRPGSRHEVDSLAFILTARERYRFAHRVTLDQPFTNPAGERFDRVQSISEYDCGRGRYRDQVARLSLGEEELRTEYFATLDWEEPEPAFREVFDQTCAFLVTLGARLPENQRSYGIRFVEQMPELINRMEISRAISREYPPLRLHNGQTGQAVVGFRIEADGSVNATSISVRSATGPDFGEAAAKVVTRMRFRPAKIGGRAVRAWVTLPVSFLIADDGGAMPMMDPPGWCARSTSSFC